MRKFQMKLRKRAVYAFLLLPFYRPFGLETSTFPFLFYFFTAWEIISVFILLLILYNNRKPMIIGKKDETRILKLYIIYTFILSITLKLFFNNSFIPLVSLFSFCVSVGISIYIAKEDYEFMLVFFYKYFYCINVLNFLFIVFPPLGNLITNDEYFFIGHRQSVPMVWALSMLLCTLKFEHSGIKRGREFLKTFILVVIASFNIINASVSTGIVVISVFLIMFVIMVVFDKVDTINNVAMYVVYIVGLVINYLIIRLNFQNNFAFFLSRYLGETTSLNGRTVIFNAFFKAFDNSKIIGYGYNGIQVRTGWGGAWDSLDYAHNTILQELSNGGIIGFALFLIAGFVAIYYVNKSPKLNQKKIVLCTLVSQLIIMCTESVNYYNYYMLFLVIITFLYKNNINMRKRRTLFDS